MNSRVPGAVVSLREHFEARLTEVERLLNERINAANKAVEIALANNDQRLGGMNEFRDALKDQASRFVTRDEIGLMLAPLLRDVQGLRESRAELAGKASQNSVIIAWLLAIVGIAIGIAGVLR